MTKRCLTVGCQRYAISGYSRCLPHQRLHWRVYNDPKYRGFGMGQCCELCGATTDLTRDHIVPLSKGGTNDLANLRTLCRSCNSSKGRTEDVT